MSFGGNNIGKVDSFVDSFGIGIVDDDPVNEVGASVDSPAVTDSVSGTKFSVISPSVGDATSEDDDVVSLESTDSSDMEVELREKDSEKGRFAISAAAGNHARKVSRIDEKDIGRVEKAFNDVVSILKAESYKFNESQVDIRFTARYAYYVCKNEDGEYVRQVLDSPSEQLKDSLFKMREALEGTGRVNIPKSFYRSAQMISSPSGIDYRLDMMMKPKKGGTDWDVETVGLNARKNELGDEAKLRLDRLRDFHKKLADGLEKRTTDPDLTPLRDNIGKFDKYAATTAVLYAPNGSSEPRDKQAKALLDDLKATRKKLMEDTEEGWINRVKRPFAAIGNMITGKNRYKHECTELSYFNRVADILLKKKDFYGEDELMKEGHVTLEEQLVEKAVDPSYKINWSSVLGPISQETLEYLNGIEADMT